MPFSLLSEVERVATKQAYCLVRPLITSPSKVRIIFALGRGSSVPTNYISALQSQIFKLGGILSEHICGICVTDLSIYIYIYK